LSSNRIFEQFTPTHSSYVEMKYNFLPFGP
jgi:hypothetical protein